MSRKGTPDRQMGGPGGTDPPEIVLEPPTEPQTPTVPHHHHMALHFGPIFHIGKHHQTLSHSESMVSLCFRSLSGFVQDDNLPGLQAFLENKQVQVDDRDENGATALMLAAGKGRSGFVRELLAHGADTNAEDADNWSSLLCAAKEGHTDICLMLLENGADIEHRDMGGWTALMWATYKGHTETAVLLLDRGADANAHGNFHISSLLWASGRGHTRIVQELVRRGAKVNVGDKYGTTALVWSSRKGYAEIVDCLLQAGANVDTAGMYSWTSLLVATQGNHVDVVNLLLEHRPNVNALDKDGCTALMIACKEGYYDIATALINIGAYINIQDRAGDTNLIHAVKGGHRGIVEALLKKYADVDICGKDRKTAVYTAVEKGNIQIVKLLLSSNPDLEIATKDGDTPLLRAVRSRHTEIVQLLLDKRAKVAATDKKGDTVLHIAMRARSKAIIEILLRNPKNSQLLYRPNKQGETAYNIDLNHQKQILGQVFGARRLNTNEDNENMLGYDLYSSALADMLSEPSLSMPITVGLYAKWGSGKSFLLNKLRDEMKNFARQWMDPAFRFSVLLFLVIFHYTLLIGTIVGISTLSWIIGLATGGSLFIFSYLLLLLLWYIRKKYDWDWPYTVTTSITKKLTSLKLILQVMFCHPPSAISTDMTTAQPIRFYFTDQTRVSSTTGGENSVVQMIGSLYDAIENNYGTISTRLYRAFRPKSKSSTTWRFRRMCCLPYIVIFEICFICLLLGAAAVTIYLAGNLPSLTAVSKKNETSEYKAITTEVVTLNVIIITVSIILGITFLANMYTWTQMFRALIFSQRRHLQRAIAKLDTLKSEGFQQALNREVALMKDMVKCLDSLSAQQTRLVVIVDGLDSCEQDKVLLVLDAVHMLFSEEKSPFIVILAIDPHVISKAVEMNSRRLFNESNIGGHDYLRNLVHLPFFLQNSGLRKVKVAQTTAALYRKPGTGWTDADELGYGGSSVLARSLSNRRLSSESALMSSNEKLKLPSRKNSRKLKLSESIASSIGSNLNMVVGAHDLTKMLLTDDYFSDVNPRSMRRLMNVVYVTGRLLKAFQIDFNWYHLASWINITEQWPYRTTWIILHYDLFEDSLDDNTSLKTLYDKVRPKIPISKEQEPLLELDRDEKKFDIFLTFHRSSLLVSDLKIFLPFTINLDPYIKKVIKEEHQNQAEETMVYGPKTPVHQLGPQWGSNTEWSNRSNPSGPRQNVVKSDAYNVPHFLNAQYPPWQLDQYNNFSQRQFNRNPLPNTMLYQPHQGIMGWNTAPSWDQSLQSPYHLCPQTPYAPPGLSAVTTLPPELFETKLSALTVKGVCQLFEKSDSDINPESVSRYTSLIEKNNINGRVLLHCDLEELKKVLKMAFGDWELFRVLIVSLREQELTSVVKHDEAKTTRMVSFHEPVRERKNSVSKEKENKDLKRGGSKQSIMEKQVTLEDQMICGALQTLNEEACEDVLEETEEDIPQTSLIPPSPDQLQEPVSRSRTSSVGGETDFVLLQANPFNKLHWQPVSVCSRGEGSHSENSSVCSTPLSKRKNEASVFISQPDQKKSLENYIMVDLKSLDRKNSDPQPHKEMSRVTENVQSSMYGQNKKHNSIQKPNNTVKQERNTKSLSLDHTNVRSQEVIQRAQSTKNVSKNNQKQRARPQSLLVTKDDASKSYIRSKSVEDRKNNSVLNCIRTKFGENTTPATSAEKLSRLKEKLLTSGPEDPNLDSDDESTPLVSDISTPSVSVGHNSAFTPTDKFSSPEKKSESTEYSPISPSPLNNTVNVSSVCNVVQNFGTQTVHESVLETNKELSNASSELSLSYYLEAPSKFSDSSLASVGSLNSEASAARTVSNSSGISRQNALDPEDNFKDLE